MTYIRGVNKMSEKARKLNFMIKNDLVRELEELVPLGKRSQVVNEAIMKELLAIRRQKLTQRLLALREKSPSLTTEEIVSILKEDRRRR
jgi:hypothetical protein